VRSSALTLRLFAALLLVAAGAARAGALEDRVRAVLAPPAVILEHQEDLRLTLAQRTRLLDLADDYQRRIDRLNSDIVEASARLVAALEKDALDRTAALAELAKVNACEAEIKRLHLDLWIESNRALTRSQRRRALEFSRADE
jgi:Spy/CpxP family protein refolding chaperone